MDPGCGTAAVRATSLALAVFTVRPLQALCPVQRRAMNGRGLGGSPLPGVLSWLSSVGVSRTFRSLALLALALGQEAQDVFGEGPVACGEFGAVAREFVG